MMITISVALLILRLVVGLTLAAHGAQRFGWFGVLVVAALLVDVIGLFISRPPVATRTEVGSRAS